MHIDKVRLVAAIVERHNGSIPQCHQQNINVKRVKCSRPHGGINWDTSDTVLVFF